MPWTDLRARGQPSSSSCAQFHGADYLTYEEILRNRGIQLAQYKDHKNPLFAEEEGRKLARELTNYMKNHDGRYLRDQAGRLHVIIGGNRIPLEPGRTNE